MQKVTLYNTATRKKEELKPINAGKIGIYSCGPTVYSSPHIGNMYSYICWDVLVRTLEYLGYEVKQVVNITDVGHLVADSDSGEDKMETGSRKEGISAWDLAKKYELEFMENLKKLNIQVPWKLPRATDHIEEQIKLIQLIETNGFTYRTSDGIYFDTAKFPGYGDFAGLDLTKMREGARVEVNEEKKNPTDFALWKFSPENEKRQMEWDSPWGRGFPGWHIECTAMSVKYLENPFDIHTGGEDHIAIHHTNEIAQGYGAWGKQTANIWMHNAFITFDGAKISKSTGGLYSVFDLEKMGYEPLAYRYMALSSHYRKGISFSLDNLKTAETALNKLRGYWFSLREDQASRGGKIDEKYRNDFVAAISNDIAMPEAMAVVWTMLRDETVSKPDRLATLIDFDRVLKLDLGVDSREKVEIPEEIRKLGEERWRAKQAKDWSLADRLRVQLEEAGWGTADSAGGFKLVKLPKGN